MKIEALEYEADLLVTVLRERVELRPESSRSSILSEPDVGVSSAPTRFMKVDFPEPECPVTARYSVAFASESPSFT